MHPTTWRRAEPPHRNPGGALRLTLALAVGLCWPLAAAGQAHDHEHGPDGHHAGLHFSHPLVTESVSPDTKIRADHRWFDFPDGAREHSGLLEGEYAFHRTVSLEVGLPFSYSEAAIGNLEATLKFASFAFEEAGILLGYGLQVAFPTNGGSAHEDEDEHDADHESAAVERVVTAEAGAAGRTASAILDPIPPPMFDGAAGVRGTLGTREWKVAPFFTAGIRRGAWEVVSWFVFAIPFRQETAEEVGTELVWDFSALHHLSTRLQAMVELNGSAGVSGAAVGEETLTVSPGLKYRIFPDRPVFLGLSSGFPVAGEEPFDARLLASVLWHL